MNLTTTYQGDDGPFEGDRTLWLRSLPEGARVTKATVTLTPKGGPEFQETFALDSVGEGELPADNWGVSHTLPGVFIEVDFHARRTLAAVSGEQGANISTITLQVDMGGAYVGIADDGTFMTPEKDPWRVDLSPSKAPLPGLTVNKFRFNGTLQVTPSGSGSSTLDVTKVVIRSVPTNVSVRLGEMPPFWTRLGELATVQTSPDFAAVLNAFLTEAKAIDGFYSIPFAVHSDSIARLDVKLVIDYVIEQPVLPSYLPEVNLPYGYSSLPGVEEDLLTVKIPRGATIASAGGAVRGTFDATRIVFGEIGESEATGTVTVSPDRSLAQPILLDKETPVNGIDLPLANTEPGLAGLHLALQEDADGKPSGKVLSSANVTVERPAPGGSSWGSAALPAEFRFLSGERYWLVLQSVSGNANWDVRLGDSAAPVLQSSDDGGFSWRTASTEASEKNLAAIFRLRHSPERFKVPLQLQVGRGSDAKRMSFDRFAPLGRVEFDADFAAELGEYLATPSMVPPCGSGNLLVNGSFDQPPHTDATRRLFGFDEGKDEVPSGEVASGQASLTSKVDLGRGIDLSVQRFILLSIDNHDAIRIDCAGTIPARTQVGEIVDAINHTVGSDVAYYYDDGLTIISPTYGSSSAVGLCSWRQEGLPQGWQGPDVAEGRIWRTKLPTIKLPTVSNSDLVNGPEVLPPERIVASLKAKGNEPVILAQRVPVAEGCTYDLSFLFKSTGSVDFREYEVGTGPNPRIEREIRFEVGDSNNSKLKGTLIDSENNVNGLNCGEKLEITLPCGTSIIELTFTNTGKFNVEAFEDDGERAGEKEICNSGHQTLRLTGTRITKVVVSTLFEAKTLLREMCFDHQTAFWEVHWQDSDGQLINSNREKLNVRKRTSSYIDRMLQGKAHLVAPSGAAQAEIRFIQPPPGVLLLDGVSFVPTFETLLNGNFQQWEAESGNQLSPVGWTCLSGWLDREFDEKEQMIIGAKLRGDGPEDAVLVQTAEIVTSESYDLRVCARPMSPAADDADTLTPEQRARLELRWLADEGEIGEPVILPLDGRDFPEHTWVGDAPSEANQAEIRLIQPQGLGDLLVESVSLERSDLVQVPLIFLAEAPGELVVSNLRVAYDQPAPFERFGPKRRAALGRSSLEVQKWSSNLAKEDASLISGVGDAYSGKIFDLLEKDRKKFNIENLAALDASKEVDDVPQERVLGMKTAAEMALVHASMAGSDRFAKLADRSLNSLLRSSSKELAMETGQPKERVEQLQRNLRALRFLLKNEAFLGLQLSDLMPKR